MPKPRFVLSTVGISLLLKMASTDEERDTLNRAANQRELQGNALALAERLEGQALEKLLEGDVRANRQLSAELNGLYGLYEGQLAKGRGDLHWLIATDTALGCITAKVVNRFLTQQGLTAESYIPRQLSSSEPLEFSAGIKDLLRWCEETIPGYHPAYEVVFNLTGGFKSLQGYLNIVGMFYADQIVYIFETSPHLLRIPRLPLRVDVETLRDWRMELALMAQGHIYQFDQVANIPAGLLEVDEQGNAALSDWGALIWNRVRQQLLGDDLLPFNRLQYTDDFRQDFKRASAAERAELQAVLAKVSSLLESHNGDISVLKRDGGLQYNNYTGKMTRDGRPIGHFRVSQSRRVSCTAVDGGLRLRRYGEHSINDNP